MSKKLIIVIGIAVILLLAVGGWVFYSRSGGTKSPVDKVAQKLLPKIQGEKTYEDESGFSFKYPKNTDVADKTPDDTDYYSLLELTSKDAGGKLTIAVSDTDFEKVSEWAKKKLVGATLTGAATLGGISASQYEVTKSGNKLQVTAAIKDGVLYEITSPADNGFWQALADLIISTFTSVQTSQAPSGSSGEDIIYEEEEVVE